MVFGGDLAGVVDEGSRDGDRWKGWRLGGGLRGRFYDGFELVLLGPGDVRGGSPLGS
ncbi:hypothetical protein GCM10020295_45890 [Streptomyces cinereospinus]